MPDQPSKLYELIYLVVRQVPPGRVTTYGQVAAIVGHGADARVVGYAMASLPGGSDVPWQRVINSEGKISLKGRTADAQRQMLETEGIVFDARGRVSLARCGWEGPEHDFIAEHGLNPAPGFKKDDPGQMTLL